MFLLEAIFRENHTQKNPTAPKSTKMKGKM